MGLFDFLKKDKGDKTEKEIAKLAKLVSDKMSQNYDRQEAIETLAKMGTAQSAEALLKRFTWTLDPSITDQEEKESAASGIVAAGEEALEPLRRFCRKAESITWPLKIIRRIVPPERVVDEYLGVLGEFDPDYVRNPEPKIQLLQALEEHPEARVREPVEPFLTDASEPVRFAAVTTLFAVNDEACVSAMAEAFAEEESLRVRNRVCQGLLDRGWLVPEDDRAEMQKAMPSDFRLVEGRVVAR